MDPLTAFTLYKICGILSGTLFGYLGYRLFIMGIWRNAGTLEASHKNNRLLLKGAAPGTFFVFLGTVIIAVTLYEGYKVYHKYDFSSATRPAPPGLP